MQTVLHVVCVLVMMLAAAATLISNLTEQGRQG